MADYIYLNNYTGSKGKLGISRKVFDTIANNAVKKIDGCVPTRKILINTSLFRLNQPIKTTIRQGIVHVFVAVDVVRDINLQELSIKIQNEINTAMLEVVETIPFDIQVKFQSIIN